MTIKQSIIYVSITGFLAIAFGAYLVITSGTYGYLLFGLGAFFVLFYTYPLKYIGLGEIAVFVVWGPLMIGGGYFVITGQLTQDVLLVAFPYALGTTGVIFGKHIDKLDMDRKKKIHTLPVLLGEKLSRFCLFLFSITPYLFVIAMVVFFNFSPILLIVFLAFKGLKISARESLKPPPEKTPDWFPKELWPHWYVAIAFYNNRQFAIFYVIGLFVDALLKRGII
jgi:1,4-dihydroxy-2-naphthoate octaprenyltransferase